MEGSVTKRKDGRWQGVVDIPNITGKRQRKYVYASTRQECRRKVNELIEQIENCSLLNPQKITFREYAQKWLDVYCENLSPTTKEGYRKSVLVYADTYIGDAILSKILPIHIQEMVNTFAKTHAVKTCKNFIGDVKGVFRFAIDNNLIKNNPCEKVKLPENYQEYQYYIYTEEQFNQLLDVAVGTEHMIPILLAGLCGMRLSEVMGLTWNDIDFEKHAISIRKANVFVGSQVIERNKTKTKKSTRKIVIPNYVIEILKDYKKVGLVFPKKDGSPEHGGNYRLRFVEFLKRNGLPHTRFHDLRHFNATMMLKKGIPDKVAASMLGHANTSMTKKYQHIIDEMDNRPAQVLDSIVTVRNKKSDVKSDVK
jgi:integrase